MIAYLVEARPPRVGGRGVETYLVEDEVGPEVHRRPSDGRAGHSATPLHPHLPPRPVPWSEAIDLIRRTVQHELASDVHELLTAARLSRQIVMLFFTRHHVAARQQRGAGFSPEIERGSPIGSGGAPVGGPF